MLMESAKNMLSGAKLGREFSAEAVDTACYLVNRSPSSPLEDKTPQEEPKKIEFELKEEESDSTTEESEDAEPQTLTVRRSVRERRQLESYSPSTFYSYFYFSVTNDDHRTVKEAVDSEDGKLWKEAMGDEMASFHKKEAWDLVELPAGRKPIGSRWVFKKKENVQGKVEKYKA
eukprot:PITA_04718